MISAKLLCEKIRWKVTSEADIFKLCAFSSTANKISEVGADYKSVNFGDGKIGNGGGE